MTTAEYGLSKAARSFNSRLDKSKLVEAGFTPLPTWQDGQRFVQMRSEQTKNPPPSIDYQMNDKAKMEYDLLQDILNLCSVYY